MEKHVNLVDLVKSFPTNIFFQNLASIQQRKSLIKFDHLDAKQSKVRYRTFQLRRERRTSKAGYTNTRRCNPSNSRTRRCSARDQADGTRRSRPAKQSWTAWPATPSLGNPTPSQKPRQQRRPPPLKPKWLHSYSYNYEKLID